MTQTALITGASSGIGLELARCFARDGYRLILIARDRQRLAQVAEQLQAAYHVEIVQVVADLSQPEAPSEIHQAARAHHLEVDVLVNNAGFGTSGYFHTIDTDKELDMIQVNMTALTHLIKLFLPGMITRKRGRILNVASTAAFQPGPLMAVYYATKAYVLSLSEALNEELRDTRVTVTALCPGPTRTGFQDRSGIGASHLVRRGLSEPAQVAAAGYRAMQAGRPVIIPEPSRRLFAFLVKVLPRRWVLRTIRRLQEQQP